MNNLAILVIDDEVHLEVIYTNFLQKLGAKVEFYDHPQKGWQAIEKQKYDLIITDLKMPVIAGDEFISIVRGSKLNAHTPIILCSGHINKLIITEVTRESKIYFLNKPFDSKSLLELVTKTLGVKPISSNYESQGHIEKWSLTFSDKLNLLCNENKTPQKLTHFDKWNFETVSLNFVIIKDTERLSVSLLMKTSTFLKVAGIIQGTQYKEIEAETLHVWQELLDSPASPITRVTFAKLLGQDFISLPNQKHAFYKFDTNSGEILAYLH